MKVAVRWALVAGLLGALALGGCAGAASAPSGGAPSMGMGGSAPGGMVSGVIAASRDASMSAPVFDRSSGTIVVSRVLAPADGWVVVQSVATGGVLGSAPVRVGENRAVTLRVKTIDGRQVRIALFVDRGERGTLEFDPGRPAASLDKPVLVDGVPVGSTLELIGWGAESKPHTALVMVDAQPARATLVVGYLLVPAPSWIEVRRIETGVPGPRLGLVLRSAGEHQRVAVVLRGARSGDELLVTVVADEGTSGRFEPGAGNPLLAVDQPWVSAGVVVSQRVRLQ
jgi:hypothetical protein